MEEKKYGRGFIPYGLAAFLIGIVGGFSTVLGPAFVADLGLPYGNTTWTALAQAMSTAACAPILGKVGDVIGRKATLLAGMAVFTLGNVLSAVANSLGVMLVARFVVGIGTAAMTPVIMAYIVTEFPPNQVAKGFTLYMLISSAAVIFGPSLGAGILAASGWRSMVWICVGICLVTLGACLLTGGGWKPKKQPLRGFDMAGGVLVVLFFSLALCVPTVGQNAGWTSSGSIGVITAAVLSGIALVLAEKRAEKPILPGKLLTARPFLLSVLALFLTQGLMQANMTNTIVFLNYTQPGDPTISGYGISVMYLGVSLGALALGPLADKWEPKRILTGSLVLTGIGCGLLLLFSSATSLALLLAAFGILGFGLGGNGTIFMKVALWGLPPREAGAGTGTYGLFRDLAAPFGVAVFVPLFTNQITAHIAQGSTGAEAAVRAIHTLGVGELACILGGMVLVWCLPNIHQQGERICD